MNSAPGGQYSLENSAWGTVFTSENCLGGHFLGGAKFPMTPACNCHYAGQSCSFPILSSLPRDHRRLTQLLNCAALMLICIYIVQCRSGYVVSLATSTKAEPLYKVHTHTGPCSQFYDRGCPHLEVILEYFLSFSFYSYIFLLYRVSVHCKQEQ